MQTSGNQTQSNGKIGKGGQSQPVQRAVMEKTWPRQMPLNSGAPALSVREMSTCVRALRVLTVPSSLSWGLHHRLCPQAEEPHLSSALGSFWFCLSCVGGMLVCSSACLWPLLIWSQTCRLTSLLDLGCVPSVWTCLVFTGLCLTLAAIIRLDSD